MPFDNTTRASTVAVCFATLFVFAAILGACATTAPNATTAAPDEPPIMLFISIEAGPLGQGIRALAEASGENIAIMNGLESVEIPAMTFDNRSFDSAAHELAATANCDIVDVDGYSFVTAPGYEALSAPILGDLNAASRSSRVDVSYGVGTPLYGALALLGRASGTTIVADNVVANARCGDLYLRDVTVREAVDALLRSARITRNRIRIRTTKDYVFIASRDTVPRIDALLNSESLDDALSSALLKSVSLDLPNIVNDAGEPLTRAVYLDDTRDTLSAQLGIPVRVSADMRALPVNPVVMNDVPLATALELLIHQWPVPEFGYELSVEGILFRRIR